MTGWIVLLLILATVSVLTASSLRGRGWDARWGGAEFWIALLLPGVGAAIVFIQLAIEGILRRKVRPADPSLWKETEGAEEEEPVSDDSAEVLSPEPFGDVVLTGDGARAEIVLRRLERTGSPVALQRIKEGLRSSDREIRIRARSAVIRAEDRLIRGLGASRDPAERGRSYWRLASLAMDAGSRRHYFRQAIDALRTASREKPDSATAVDLARVLVDAGECEEARRVLDPYVAWCPLNPEGWLARADVHFRLGDAPSLRGDLARLASCNGGYGAMARRWNRC